jgi:hypothetical protein
MLPVAFFYSHIYHLFFSRLRKNFAPIGDLRSGSDLGGDNAAGSHRRAIWRNFA